MLKQETKYHYRKKLSMMRNIFSSPESKETTQDTLGITTS